MNDIYIIKKDLIKQIKNLRIYDQDNEGYMVDVDYNSSRVQYLNIDDVIDLIEKL